MKRPHLTEVRPLDERDSEHLREFAAAGACTWVAVDSANRKHLGTSEHEAREQFARYYPQRRERATA
jgi:Ser/Thr protein kinase RdoA (MazF antagonist)